MYKALLENWFVARDWLGNECVMAYTYLDERHNPETTEFAAGHRILTSKIKELRREENLLITESGSRYFLSTEYVHPLLDGEYIPDYAEALRILPELNPIS